MKLCGHWISCVNESSANLHDAIRLTSSSWKVLLEHIPSYSKFPFVPIHDRANYDKNNGTAESTNHDSLQNATYNLICLQKVNQPTTHTHIQHKILFYKLVEKYENQLPFMLHKAYPNPEYCPKCVVIMDWIFFISQDKLKWQRKLH